MKQYISIIVFAAVLLGMVSCKKDKFMDPEEAPGRDEVIYLWAGKPAQEDDEQQGPNKIIYRDSLGLSGKGASGFTMNWEKNDTLYAILWEDDEQGKPKKATDKYIILKAIETGDGHQMFFQGTTHGDLRISQLKGGEHFVLVHGHFVLDPTTDGGVFDFPTSEVTKAGYAKNIHHGGVEDSQGGLTFRNQDGTLANLKKHEYMVADSYVRFQKVTVEGGKTDTVAYLAGHKIGTIGQSTTTGEKTNPDENPTGVQMRSAHTLLRLTMFVPDGMFDQNIDFRLLAASLRTADNQSIFHRYFRLHPNTPDAEDPTKWTVDWNNQGDKESNIYFRANFPGTRRYNEINNPQDPMIDPTADPTKLYSGKFNPNMTACVGGANGHYVTLYFSLPSKPLAPDAVGNTEVTPSNLFVTVFTRTHAFRSVKSYSINSNSMKPGKIATLNVNFATGTGEGGTNYIKIPAVTDPNLGVTFAPGIVYATRAKSTDNWSYGIYTNQGEYAGLNQQTNCMGDYFIFGSVDPTEVFHQHLDGQSWVNCANWKPNWKVASDLTVDNDVAAKAVFAGQSNVFSTMSKKEAERVWAQILKESAAHGVNKGFYYYDAKDHDTDDLHHTAHQAVGAHIANFLNSGGYETQENIERKKTMSSTMGIWIGINRQPTLAEQDMYVFLPSSHQLNNSINNMQWYDSELHEWFADDTESSEEAGYENVETYRYAASADYGKQHVFCYEGSLPSGEKESDFRNIPTTLSNGTILNHYYLIKSRTKNDGKTKEYGLEGTEYSSLLMKFSTNTRNVNSNKCERFQVWYSSGSSFHTSSNIQPMDQTFGRVVRPVIY